MSPFVTSPLCAIAANEAIVIIPENDNLFFIGGKVTKSFAYSRYKQAIIVKRMPARKKRRMPESSCSMSLGHSVLCVLIEMEIEVEISRTVQFPCSVHLESEIEISRPIAIVIVSEINR